MVQYHKFEKVKKGVIKLFENYDETSCYLQTFKDTSDLTILKMKK
jgi:hypothetical protein